MKMGKLVDSIKRALQPAVKESFGLELDPLVKETSHKRFGDFQSNVAFQLAKSLQAENTESLSPREVAEKLQDAADLGTIASEVNVAGPGFLNITLSPNWIAERLQEMLVSPSFGAPIVERPERIVIDYSGPNVAKQMHVGHLRPTNIGDALARILEFVGHDVIRQNHVGDWGTQFGMLIQYLKENDQVDTVGTVSELEKFYKEAKVKFDADSQFAERARQAVVSLQRGDLEAINVWQKIVELSRQEFEYIYERLGVSLTSEHERGESFYNSQLGPTIDELVAKGIAEESEGAIVVWAPEFNSPLIVRKSDGGFNYAATDITAAKFRAESLGGERLIYVTDARQADHFAKFFFAVQQAGWMEDTDLTHVKFGTILGQDGRPFKTRSGDTIKLAALLDEAEDRAMALVQQKLKERDEKLPEKEQREIARAVGIGAIKYFDLNRDPNSNYLFSWENMLSLDGNTAPYLQYAYARVCSILRKGESSADNFQVNSAELSLSNPAELSLAKHLLMFDEAVMTVVNELKPHHLCNYLFTLANRFSTFYHDCPVLTASDDQKATRLLLCHLTKRGIAQGLDLLGIDHPERM